MHISCMRQENVEVRVSSQASANDSGEGHLRPIDTRGRGDHASHVHDVRSRDGPRAAGRAVAGQVLKTHGLGPPPRAPRGTTAAGWHAATGAVRVQVFGQLVS